jgi:hypothetical protein
VVRLPAAHDFNLTFLGVRRNTFWSRGERAMKKDPHVSRGRPLPSYNHPFLLMPKPEAFSRVLIDQELRESGWDLLDERRVRFELDGHSGRADYVLSENARLFVY